MSWSTDRARTEPGSQRFGHRRLLLADLETNKLLAQEGGGRQVSPLLLEASLRLSAAEYDWAMVTQWVLVKTKGPLEWEREGLTHRGARQGSAETSTCPRAEKPHGRSCP